MDRKERGMLRELESLVEGGYISRRKHPRLDLYILNYTPRAQYEGLWNETTEQCRGLVVDGSGRVVSRCLRKFFNHDEVRQEVSSRLASGATFETFEKVDGSLGITYWDGGRPMVATRGSFTSDQAVRASSILAGRYGDARLDPDLTYLFEIVYPENRICVDYGAKEDLVLLAAVHTESGREVDAPGLPFPRPDPFDLGSDFDRMSELNLENREGFVVRFEDGFRFKIKFADYVALHRSIFSVSSRTIWSDLRAGREPPLDLLPAAVRDWAAREQGDLRRDYAALECRAAEIFGAIRHLPRKDFAAAALEYRCHPILFLMLDGRPYGDQIWRMVEPNHRTPRGNEEA